MIIDILNSKKQNWLLFCEQQQKLVKQIRQCNEADKAEPIIKLFRLLTDKTEKSVSPHHHRRTMINYMSQYLDLKCDCRRPSVITDNTYFKKCGVGFCLTDAFNSIPSFLRTYKADNDRLFYFIGNDDAIWCECCATGSKYQISKFENNIFSITNGTKDCRIDLRRPYNQGQFTTEEIQ